MSKETLAKLMAIEDINVENRKVPTAAFDLKSRTLILPIWKDDLSEHVTDLLVGHEVAHALYSPAAEWFAVCEDKEVPKSYVNILEDIRIEKAIKKKFPGLRKSFVYGYEEMVKDKIHNIFGLDEKITLDGDYKLLIDRINLQYKVGLVKDIPFLEDEQFLLNKISSLESFQDVVDLAKEIFEFSKQKMEDEEEQEEQQSSQGSSDEESESSEETESEESPESEETEDEETESESDSSEEGDEESDSTEYEEWKEEHNPLESVTEDLFDSAKDKMIDDSEYDNSYVSYPAKPINHKPFVEDYKDYMSNCGKIVSQFSETWRRHEIKELLDKLAEFKRDSQKTVNYMVKEFEMKKAADAYKRITQSKTGIIDVNKLHSYKYNEDLFRKVSVTPDGKNHGVVMFIDWSGSMAGELFNTMKQVLNLVMFCKKVNIPFEVYSFTDREEDIENWPKVKMNEVQTPKQGQYGIGTQFRLVNMLSSRMNGKEFKKAMELVFINASYDFNWDMQQYALAQTPLNQCIAVSESLLSEFKSSNNLQIVNAIYLTDGENNGITGSFNFVKGNPESNYDSNKVDRFELNRVFGSYNSRASYLVDQKTKKQYTIHKSGNDNRYSRNRYRIETLTLLEILKDRIGVNVIGFHLVNTKRLPRFIDDSLYRMSGGDMEEYYSYSKVEELKRNFRKTLNKDRFYALDEFGYDDYYVLPNNKLDTKTEELEIDSDMKKSQIKKQFIKHNKSKTVNRVLLTRFIEKICN